MSTHTRSNRLAHTSVLTLLHLARAEGGASIATTIAMDALEELGYSRLRCLRACRAPQAPHTFEALLDGAALFGEYRDYLGAVINIAMIRDPHVTVAEIVELARSREPDVMRHWPPIGRLAGSSPGDSA